MVVVSGLAGVGGLLTFRNLRPPTPHPAMDPQHEHPELCYQMRTQTSDPNGAKEFFLAAAAK